MRRPAVDPELRTHTVVQKNMMQGMAGGRIPSAYPVPRLRIPRIMGGGSPPAPTYLRAANIATLDTAPSLYPAGNPALTDGDLLVSWTLTGGGTITPPSGWTTVVSDTVGPMGYLLCHATYSSSLDLTGTNASAYPISGRTFVFRGAGSLAPTITTGPTETTGVQTVSIPAATGTKAWQVMGGICNTTFSWDWETNAIGRVSGSLDYGVGYVGHFCSEPLEASAYGEGPFPSPGSPTTYVGNYYANNADFVTMAVALA